MEGLTKREERVRLPKGWNSYDDTWVKKDGFKDQKGKEITDIDDKIKKFIELLDKVKVSEIKGGVTNFCFRFPDIVKNVFGTKCEVQKGTFFSKDKSTNPFDYKDFCGAIFNFINKNPGSEDAKKQNYCLLFEMIFMKSGFIGNNDSFKYDRVLKNTESHIRNIFDKKTWDHMPIISSLFMQMLYSRINAEDIKKHNLKFVLKAKNKGDNTQEISSYGSIIVDDNSININEKTKETKIEALNKLKLSYYEALFKYKFDSKTSKEFFNSISFTPDNYEKSNLVEQINQYTSENILQNDKQNLQKLRSLPEEIIESKLKPEDKSELLISLFRKADKITDKCSDICWNMAKAAMKNLPKLINKSEDENDISSLSNALHSVCSFALSKKFKNAYEKVSQAFISVVPSIDTSNFKNLLKLLRGDTTKDPTSNYLGVITSVAQELATAQKTNQATHKLEHLLDLVKCEEKKDENKNSQDQDQKKNALNKKEESKNKKLESKKNVEIVNKNINSEIFQWLFRVIDKCYPLFNNKNEFNCDNFSKRSELRNTLFENFLKADKGLRNAQNTCLSVAKKIMNKDTLNKINDKDSVCSELEFLIRVVIDGYKKFSLDPNKSVVTSDKIQELIGTIERYFPSSNEDDKEANNNNRYKLIKYLFELLKGQNIDNNVFMLLFNKIDEEFTLLSENEENTISPKLKAEDLKKRNELLGKLSNVSAIVDSKKNKTAQSKYFSTVNKMINAYKSDFLRKNTVNTIIGKDKNKNKNEDEKKKLILESLIRMTILGQVKLSPEPTKSKVKYKDIMQLIDIVEKSFPSDSEDDKNNRYDLIKCLFEQFNIVKDFLFPCDEIWDTITEFAFSNVTETFKQGLKLAFNKIIREKKITDFFPSSKESAEKTEETKDKISDVKNTQEKPENAPKEEKNKKVPKQILSYREILPAQINDAVDNYNKKLKKDQINEKFNLDTQIFDDIQRHNVMKKISELNKIINNNSPDLKNPVIDIFCFLSDKKFNLDQFLSDFQSSYLNTVVNLINLGSKVLDLFIKKQDVTKEIGELFQSKDKNKNENNGDKFNSKLVYNKKLQHMNELIINNFARQGIKKVVENLDKFFGKPFKDEKDKNKNLINEERQCNILQNKIDTVSQKITSSLLKKFGSVYGLISKIQTVAQNIGKNREYNTTASAIFDFVLDCINDENDKDSNLLSLLLELVGVFDFGNLNIEKDSVQSKKIIYSVINSFMGLITLSKALDYDTEIFANDKNINNKKKTTNKLINLLKKIVDTKKFKDFVEKLLSEEYVNKIGQLINDVSKLKFEDCAYLLCSNEILAQNKENQREDEKVKEEKNQNIVNAINVINEKDNGDKLLDNKNLIKEENGKESKLDIILDQTAMFAWLRKNKDCKTTFFDLTKSLSDEKKIKKFDEYKKEQIKNDKKEQTKVKNIEVNDNTSEKEKIDLNVNKIENDPDLNNNKQLENDITKKNQIEKNLNSNELKDEINNGKDNINKINIDTNSQGNEFDKNKYEKMMQNKRTVTKQKKPKKVKFVLDEKNGDKKENGQNKVETNTMKHKEINDKKDNKNKIYKDNNNIDNKEKQSNVGEKQKEIFDSIRKLFDQNKKTEDEKKNINNKKTSKRRNSFMVKDKFLLDEQNGSKTGNQIKINDENNDVENKINELKKEENIKDKTKSTNSNVGDNVEVTENNFHANTTNIKEIDIKNNIIIEKVEEEDKKENKNNVKDINENNNIVNLKGHKEEEDKNIKKKTEINSSLIKDQFNKGKDEGIENGKIIDAVEIKKEINENEENVTGIKHNTKNKDKIERSKSFVLSSYPPNQTDQIKNNNSTILANQIQTTKSNQKNKIIAAIIFGITSVLSVVVLIIALLEALKLLVIITIFVLAVTFITTIVFIILIFRDNKVNELKNDKSKNHLNIGESENDKNITTTRRLSIDLSGKSNLTKYEFESQDR